MSTRDVILERRDQAMTRLGDLLRSFFEAADSMTLEQMMDEGAKLDTVTIGDLRLCWRALENDLPPSNGDAAAEEGRA